MRGGNSLTYCCRRWIGSRHVSVKDSGHTLRAPCTRYRTGVSIKKINYQYNSAMVYHLNHLFNPARSMHIYMYVTDYSKLITYHWRTQCRHKYLTGLNQLNPERQNFFSPAKPGPWPRQVHILSLRGNKDCTRLLLVLNSQFLTLCMSVLLNI